MSKSLSRQARRKKAKQLGNIKSVEQLKAEITNDTVKRINNGVIAAMLVAMNMECGIGPQRATKVLARANDLLDKHSLDILIKMAEERKLF